MASNIQLELATQTSQKDVDTIGVGVKRRNSGLETEFAERIHELNTVVRRRVSICSSDLLLWLIIPFL